MRTRLAVHEKSQAGSGWQDGHDTGDGMGWDVSLGGTDTHTYRQPLESQYYLLHGFYVQVLKVIRPIGIVQFASCFPHRHSQGLGDLRDELGPESVLLGADRTEPLQRSGLQREGNRRSWCGARATARGG